MTHTTLPPGEALPPLYLASASPRRRELLAQIGLACIQLPMDIDETVLPDESPADYVLRLAVAKARAELAVQVQAIQRDGLLRAEARHFGDPEFDEMADVLLKMKMRRPYTLADAVKATGLEAEPLEKLLDEMLAAHDLNYK